MHRRFADDESDFLTRLKKARSLWNETNKDLLKGRQTDALKYLKHLHHLFPENSTTLKTVANISGN
jgi:outer membrane protein assembly factor BamD (BamD/ComL family)